MIIRKIVTEENQIKLLLKTLCNQRPISCKKESISGFNSNDRVIVVRDQCFQYHNQPNKFKNGDISLLNEKTFKAKVKLSDIYEIAFLPQDKAEKNSMMLSIPLNKINATNIQLYKESAIKSSKDKQIQDNYIVSWLFKFEFDVKSQIFKQLEEIQKKKKEEEAKIIKYDFEQDLQDSILNISKDKIDVNQPEDPVKDLHKNIEKLKQIRQELEFQQKMQKQEEERQKAIKLSMSLRKNQKGTQQANEQQEDIYPVRGVWQQFWRAYEKASRFIGQPVTKQYLQKQIQVLGQMHKIQSEVKSIATEYINFKMVGWAPDKIMFDEFQFYKGIWIKLGGKELNQEFLSNFYLADIMYVIKVYKKMKFRIPPLFFVNYKSIKALCMIDLPFSKIKALQKQIYNIKTQKSKIDIQLMAKIKICFQFFQKILNVKSETYINGNIQTNAPLGHTVKVFEYDNKFQQNASNFLQNFYYVTGVKGLFPLDYQFQQHKYKRQYCLRPQIIAEYRDYMESVYRQDNQLLTQAFLNSEIHLQVKGAEDIKVAEVSQDFIPLKIKKLMNEFNQINLIMVDSFSIKNYMSEMGINARYLGAMHDQTEIPYIQETLQIEMLARTVKRIYIDSVKELITNQSFFKRELYLKKHKEVLIENIKTHHDLMVNNAIDYLNLVFGIGKQTQAFWKIVLAKCKSKFGKEFSYPIKVKPGCLLHAVLWHCGFIVTFDMDIKLFEVQKPFDLKNWNDFRLECKSFQYPSFQINKLVKKLSFFNGFDQGDQQIKKCMFEFLKIQLFRNNNSFGLGLQTQITLAKINNLHFQFQKPIRECSFHPCELPYYFSNKSQQSFKKALDIINFSLASNHPLFISLYDQYSNEFEPQLLKKSTLLAAIKGLGQFHPRTTELYSKYYRQGLEQFQIKAKRSSDTQAALTISEQLFQKKKFQSCLNFCFSRIEKRQRQKSSSSGSDLNMYIEILKYGLISAVNTRFYQKGFIIAEQFSQMINTYKIRNPPDHQILIYYALIIQLNLTSQKFYMYKMVLLVVKIQKQFEPKLPVDEQLLLLPRSKEEKVKILNGIINEYYLHETHSKWIENIFTSLKRGYIYFNYLNDLFNNYHYHIKNYGMQDFENALGYLDVLVRYFGQKIFYESLYKVNN